jgi:predicted NodU family carbamoyl transferase
MRHVHTDIVTVHVQVLNTSFNVMKEPIVDSPEDAVRYMLQTINTYCIPFYSILRSKRQ